MKKTLKFIVCLIILKNIQARRHRHDNHKDNDEAPQPYYSYLIVDSLGNCHTQDQRIQGRCIDYRYCSSAIRAWNEQRTPPLTCHSTAYGDSVCCTSDVNAMPPNPLPTFYNANPFYQYSAQVNPYQYYPNIPFNQPSRENKVPNQFEENISDSECKNYYLRSKRRGKRELPSELSNKVEDMITRKNISDTEVVGGTKTYEYEHPYMCTLGWKSKQSSSHTSVDYNCGCVLIAPKYVLTAAHCVVLGGEPPSEVRIGGLDLDDRHAETKKIRNIIQHPDYVDELAYHDIAIIELKKKSRETPACLWSIETLPQQYLIALGYGQTKFAGPSSNSLLEVTLNVTNNQECSKYYKPENKLLHGIGPGQICAGAHNMDTCQGDSGGPLLMQWQKQGVRIPYVVGLTSYGEGCAGRLPGIYTRISNYIEWIEDIVWS